MTNNGSNWNDQSAGQWRMKHTPKTAKQERVFEMARPKTAALYARFSSDLQHDSSIGDQFAICETYAAREGFRIIPELKFFDKAKTSATLKDRDGWADLMTAVRARKCDIVIVECMDRISREPEDLAGINNRFKYANVVLHTLNEGIADDMKFGFRGIMGAAYLKDLGDKVRRHHTGRAKEGLFPGCVTYGYKTVAGKKGEREIDAEKAAVVRRIFTEYAKGVSPRIIASDLTRDGIPSPMGGKWNYQGFVGGKHEPGIISNELYIGRLNWNVTFKVRDPETKIVQKRLSAERDRIVKPVPHLRIIDQELWDAAQAVRQGRSTKMFGPSGGYKRRATVARKEHLLTDLLRCGVCNGKMSVGNGAGRNGQPRVCCSSANANGTCEHRKSYDLGRLQRGVIEGFRDNLIDPKVTAELARTFHTRYAENAKNDGAERATVEKQRNRLVLQIGRIVDAISDSDEALPALVAKLREKEAERVGLEERLRQLGGANNVIALHPNVIEDYCKTVKEMHEALMINAESPVHRAAFRNLIDSIVVRPTAARMPYEFDVYGRLSAMLGVDLFPTQRSNQEILESEGVSCCGLVKEGVSGAVQHDLDLCLSRGSERGQNAAFGVFS
jgi:site-specific DNA recombinase